MKKHKKSNLTKPDKCETSTCIQAMPALHAPSSKVRRAGRFAAENHSGLLLQSRILGLDIVS